MSESVGDVVGEIGIVARVFGDDGDALIAELRHFDVVFAIDRPERLVFGVGETDNLGQDGHLLRANITAQQFGIGAQVQLARSLRRRRGLWSLRVHRDPAREEQDGGDGDVTSHDDTSRLWRQARWSSPSADSS